MLSGTVRAVLMSWVTMRKVASICALRSTISWLRYAVRTGSRPESGSSNSSTCGSRTRARARPARLRIPPEISPGSFFSAPDRPVISIFSMTMSLISRSDFFVCSRSGNAMLSKRFCEPNSAPSWNRTPNSLRISYSSFSRTRVMSVPSMTIEPFSGLSSPMRVLRKTDLPVPDGPSRTLISPAGRVRLTFSQMVWRPKRLVRSVTVISTPTASLHFGQHRIASPGRRAAVILSGVPDRGAAQEFVTVLTGRTPKDTGVPPPPSPGVLPVRQRRGGDAPVGAPPPRDVLVLLEGDRRAGALEGRLRLLGGVLRGLLQNRLRRTVDEVLGLLQAEARDRAHLLDDLDLLVAGRLEDDVELVLLGSG